MDQQSFPEIKSQPKSKRPLVALILALSSAIFCGIPFAIGLMTKDSLFIYWGNFPLWIFAESVLCVGALVTLTGVIVAGISLARKDENKVMAIAAIPFGIIAVVALVLAMFFFLLLTFMSQ